MNLVDIVTIVLNSPRDAEYEALCKDYSFPRMYALSKTGAVRVYDISVKYCGDHSLLITRKKVTINGKWTEDTYEYWSGVNIGKSNETSFHEQALFEATSVWNKLKDAGFTTTIPDPEKKFNTDANGKIKPMLANTFSERRVVFPCLCQPKYDGVRCTISSDDAGVHIISRKGKPYKIPHLERWAKKNISLLPLDGELYNHGELSFQTIISAVKKVSPITDKIRYVIYDRPIPDVTNLERWKQISRDFPESLPKDSPVYKSDWAYCENIEDIRRYHKQCVAKGYEGVIVRNYLGTYEFGFRSNDLMKYKEFDEEEFQIAGVVEATGRDAGTAVFVLYLPGHGEVPTNENTFRSKPQGERKLRKEYFDNRDSLIGLWATVQYQGLSDSGVPRFPSTKIIRNYE